MEWDQLPALLGALGVMVTGVMKFTGQSARLRSRIRHDQDTLEKMESGPTRALLARHIEATVRELVRLESERAKRTNDWFGVGVAVALLAMAVGLAVWALNSDWALVLSIASWFFVLVLALLGIAGLAESVNKKPHYEGETRESHKPTDGNT